MHDTLISQPTTDPGPPMTHTLAGPQPPAIQEVTSRQGTPELQPAQPPRRVAIPSPGMAAGLADPFLALAADVVDDLERVRIANENRLRQLTRDESDVDGEDRGFGLTLDHPDVARLALIVTGLADAEHQAVLNLQRLMRKHPLGPWAKAQIGIGEKQIARLLAAIGDPYWNTLHARPRTVSELWAYSGYHVVSAGQSRSDAPGSSASGEYTGSPDHHERDTQAVAVGTAAKRVRGVKANWSATAKMRTYLIAESCIKQRSSPFRPIYDQAREHYAESVHLSACVRCGPKGKPAAVGTPLSDGHKHARAMRKVSKEILKELWREARKIHTGEDDD